MIGNTYVAFEDNKENWPAKTFTKYDEKKLQELNRKWWGIYCTVNNFEATPEQIKDSNWTTRRQLPFLSKINWLYLDLDIAKDWEQISDEVRDERKAQARDDLIKFCEPTIIVETKNWLQPVWKLKDTEITEDYKKRWTEAIIAMIEWSKTVWSYWDWVKDFTRVLRVPHFYHMKSKPYMCEIIYTSDKEYLLEEIEITFWEYYWTNVEEEIQAIVKEKEEVKFNNSVTEADTYRAIEWIDFQEIVIRAFSSVNRSASFDNKKRLILDWRLTGTHQGKTWDGRFLASDSHEPYVWNAVTVVADIQSTNNKEAFKRILNEFNLNTDWTKKKTKIEKKVYWKQWYLYPSEVFDEFDCFMSWELVTIIAESNSWKTTFAMDIIQTNANRGKKWFYINLEFDIRTMWQSRWIWLNWKKKRNLTDIAPLSKKDKKDMDDYVDKKLKQFDYYNRPDWIWLEELIDYIIQKDKEWYWLIVIDTFSRIRWNLNSKTAHTSQNQAMERLQELAQWLWIAIVMLHHTNKAWVFEWSQKIMDLSNVFIVMNKNEWADWIWYRTFSLSKDKFVTSIDIDVYFVNQKYMSEEEYTWIVRKTVKDSLAWSY